MKRGMGIAYTQNQGGNTMLKVEKYLKTIQEMLGPHSEYTIEELNRLERRLRKMHKIIVDQLQETL